MAEDGQQQISRRTFIGTAAAAGALLAAGGCSGGKSYDADFPPMIPKAPDGPELKAGLIGCGGRGTGAIQNFLNAGSNLKVVALADAFADRVELCREQIKKAIGVEIPDENCFSGLDGYKKLLETDIDIVMMATSPYYRPEHFAAAVEAGKHCFVEKPVAVDPVGIRSIIQTAAVAKTKGLSVVTGTQRRHSAEYIETYKRIMDGAIGDIVAARIYYNTGPLWHRLREKGWSDLDWMIRDWGNWCWQSGDHIVEQHIHNIDAVLWFTGVRPAKAVGVGSRQRRVTGDQFDNFFIDYEMTDGRHMTSMCRQIEGCSNYVGEVFVGTNGWLESSNRFANTIFKRNGDIAWRWDKEENPPKDQEHVTLVNSIRTGEPVNYAEDTAISTLTAIQGREAAYTGEEIVFDEFMDSDLELGPPRDKGGRIRAIATIPVAGTAGKTRG